MHWRYNGDVMCHLAVETRLRLRTCTSSKNTVFREYWQNFWRWTPTAKRVEMLLTEIWETCSTDQRHETGRLKHTCTKENGWNEKLECGWNGRLAKPQRPETNILFSMPDIQRHRSKKSSIVQIVHCIFGWKCILFTNTLAFSCIYISQGSVVT